MTTPDHPSTDTAPLTVEWRGVTYTLPPAEEWPVEVLEAMEDGKAVTFVRSVLGAGQWVKAKQSMTVTDLSDLAEEIAQAYGFQTSGE